MRFFTTALTVVSSLAAIVAAAPGAAKETGTVPAPVPSASGAPELSSSTNPITSPLGDKVLKAGEKFEITWIPTYGSTVSLTLRAGSDSNNLDKVGSIVGSTTNDGAYTWTIPADLEEREDYAIEIIAGNTANYSPRFEISKTGEHVEHTTTKSTSSTAKPSSTSASEATKTVSTVKVTTTADAANTTTKAPITAPTAPSGVSGAGKLGGSFMAVMVAILGAVVLN